MSESIKSVGKGYTVWVNKNAEFHRLDGPAIEWNNGGREWWQNGKRHRVEGPAISFEGHEEWYQYGNLHRIDGPAVEWRNGVKEWHLNGHRYDSVEEWFKGLTIECQKDYLFNME